jgi:hypothetical protein
MTPIPFTAMGSAAPWRGVGLAADRSWLQPLTEAEREALLRSWLTAGEFKDDDERLWAGMSPRGVPG